MILHTLCALPDTAAFAGCLRIARPGDTVLLMGDAVYAAQAGAEALQTLRAQNIVVRALASDCEARAVALAPDIPAVQMPDFVALTEHYPRQLAWY